MTERSVERAWWGPVTRGIVYAVPIVLSLVHARFGYSHHDLSGHAWGADDAYIAYRYARNLAEGSGLVFNPGERVEGYSNLLYTLALAAGLFVLPPARVYGFSVGINVLSLAAAIWLFERTVRRFTDPRTAVLGVALLGASPALWVAPGTGLETCAVLVVQLGIWSRLVTLEDEQRWWGLASWSCVAGLLRADGFVMPVLVSIYLYGTGRRRVAVKYALAVAACVAAISGWRYLYYGSLLPNTFYAKVAGDFVERLFAGLRSYLGICARSGLWVHVVVLVASFFLLVKPKLAGARTHNRVVGPTVYLGVAWCAYFVYIGGDEYGERFLLPLIPLGLAVWMTHLGDAPSRWRLVVSLLILGIMLAPVAGDARFRYRVEKYDRWVTLGRFLAATHPDATLAIDAAGKVPYFAGLPTIDLLGLTDRVIGRGPEGGKFQAGHTKFAPGYVLGRRPDLIAAWITPNLDLLWGVSRERYEAAGYSLLYLCNAAPEPRTENIREVRLLPESEVRRLVEGGYAYAVVSRSRDQP